VSAVFSQRDNSIVVVVGSGAGGGTLANQLAQKGIDVVCLEAGPHLSLADFRNDPDAMFAKLSWLDPRVGSGDLLQQFPAWICKTVGGTTTHWAGASLRFQAHEWKARSTYGEIDGANLMDWPISHEEMAPWYDRAEKLTGTTGSATTGLPRLPGNNNYRVLEFGARRLGYSQVHTGNLAINSKPYGGRPACQQIGFCTSGCVIGAKWSTLYTEIPQAEATDHFELRAGCHVSRIEHDNSGKVSGVVYFDAEGVEQRQSARAVCVAGNAIETPRLLLLSESGKYPHGLANGSGQVGRNYMAHTTGAAFAVMPGEVHMNRGTQMAGIVRDEEHHDAARGFAGGYELETLPMVSPVDFALNALPGGWGRDNARAIEGFRNAAGLWIVGEDMPVENNRVTLDADIRDQHGLPVAHVHKVDHANDKAMQEDAWKQSRALYDAAGAKSIHTRGAFPSTHNMGTCRQSENENDGVCNSFGQTHQIGNLFISDGSQFTTSAAENPTLTIVALAIRQADYIARQMSQKRL
jgi:choline dehydrogenase-like flavoprotein